METRLMLNNYAKLIHAEAERKGFKVSWENVPLKLVLIHSEVSEALEEHRKGESVESYEAFAEELADIMIRTMDLAAGLNIDLEQAIITKMDKNSKRPFLHGKRY